MGDVKGKLYLNASGKKPRRPKTLDIMPADGTATEPGPHTSTSPHLNTVRTLGILHELQDYVNSVESLTNEQKQELLRLREEKRDIKRMARHHAQGIVTGQGPTIGVSSDFFRQSQIQELPPRLRAVLEDNKAMKEKLRTYKQRALASEHMATQKTSQIIVMENAISTLKQQLAACSRTPADVESEENLKSQLYTSGRAIKSLEYEVNVLKQKVETDAKLHRQAIAASKREQGMLEKKIILLNATVAEKDVELRKAHLEIRQLLRRLAPRRGLPSYAVSASLEELEAQEYLQQMGDGGEGPSLEEAGLVEQQEGNDPGLEQAEGYNGEQQGERAHEEEGALASVLSLATDIPAAEQQQPEVGPEQSSAEEHNLGCTAGAEAARDAALVSLPAVEPPLQGNAGADGGGEQPSPAQAPDEQPRQAEGAEAGGLQVEGLLGAVHAEEALKEGEPQAPVAAPPAVAEEAPPADASQGQTEGAADGKSPAIPEQGAGPEGSLHSAAPKPVPFRHTAAARAKAQGQRKGPSPPAGPPKSSPAARGAARPAKGQGTDHAQASDGAASAVDATHGAAAVPRAGTICSAGSTQLAADAAGVRPGPVSAGDAAAVQAAVKSTSAQPEVASAAVAAAAVAAAADLAQPPAAEDLAGDLASAQPTAEAAAAVSHVSGEGVTEQAAAGAPAAEMPLSETVQPAAESAPRLAQPPAVRSEIEQLGALAGAGARMAAEDSTMVPGAPAASTTEACPAAESATAAEPAGATAAEPADDQPEAPAANKTAQPAVEQASGLPGTAAALETAQQAVEQAGELPGTAAALETEQQAVEKAGELPNTAAAAGPEGAQPEASAAAASGEVIEPPSNAAAPAEGAEVFNEGLLKTLEGLVAVKGKTDGDDAAQNAGGTTAA